MPELPEVETTLQGIKPHLEEQRITQVDIHNPSLRLPIPDTMPAFCEGKSIVKITRRAKYLIIDLSQGHLLIHLGMSGHLRIASAEEPVKKHEHVVLHLSNQLSLRFYDPRRFGLFLYVDHLQQHPLLNHLGPEPLFEDFHAAYLYQCCQNKKKPIKSLLMDNKIVVGVGNIYASESLFLAKIPPLLPSKNLSLEKAAVLVTQIKATLSKAITCGGTTLRDFYNHAGKPGYFSIELQVYGRNNQPCFVCQTPIQSLFIAGRNSYFCPQCQAEDFF